MQLVCSIILILPLLFSCGYKERLNPQDPLSPYYQKDTITIVSNVNITINYTNSTIIDEDTVWSKTMSPIKIVQNYLITDGATLTIEAGTEIEFYSIGGNEIGIIIDNGALKAIGTIPEPVKFYAIDGALAYIVFRNVSIDSKCELRYCNLSQIFVTCIAAMPTINYNKIMDLSLYSDSSGIIKFNDIETLNCNDSSPTIKNNLFYLSSFNSSIRIDGNSSASIYSNNIYGGSSYCIENLSSFTQYAMNNYWGVTTTNEIASKIYDFTDNSNSGTVVYVPYYTNSLYPTGAGW